MSSRMVTHGRRTRGDGQRERVTQTATHAHCCRPQQQPPPCRSSSNNYRGYGNNLQLLLLLRLLQLQLRPLSTKRIYTGGAVMRWPQDGSAGGSCTAVLV